MLTKEELFEMACDPNRKRDDRLHFWARYELMCWVEAVRDRGLRFCAFDDKPLYRAELIQAVRAAEITPPPALPSGDTVPFIA